MTSASFLQRHLRGAILLAAIGSVFAALLPATPAISQGESAEFPAAGRRYLAIFPTFRSELNFHSNTSLTWTFLGADGSRGRSETVAVRIQPIGPSIFIVTWQEANKTTVVQVEDFTKKLIFTNVTRPDGTFLQSRGTFEEVQ